MKNAARLLLTLVPALLLDCSTHEKNPVTPKNNVKIIESSTALTGLIDRGAGKFDSLLKTMDTTAAIEALTLAIAADPSVDSAIATQQGVSIFYQNGLRGIILVDPQDEASVPIDLPNLDKLFKEGNSPTDRANIPASKKLIFMNSHYFERQKQANLIIKTYDVVLPKAGFTYAKFLDDQVTLDLLSGLSDYGFIHLYSHGYAWPNSIAISDVYVMAGQVVDAVTSQKYLEDIRGGNIVFSRANGHGVYFVNSRFLTSHNDFKQTKPLFYGGFCFSYLGSFAVDLITAGVSAYTGFTWAVWTDYNAWWARHLVATLCDTTVLTPWNVGLWFDSTDTATVPKSYVDETKKVVTIHYNGDGLTNLWARFGIFSLDPDSGKGGTQVVIKGNGFGNSQGASSITFNTLPVTVIRIWTNDSIVVLAPTGATTGNVIVNVAGKASNGLKFKYGELMKLTSINPSTGGELSTISLRGSGFGNRTTGASVLFGTKAATFISWSDTLIVVNPPSHSGSVSVTVHTGSGLTSNALPFLYAAFSISSISPDSGAYLDTITIRGFQFGPYMSSVIFDKLPSIPVLSWSDTLIRTTVPATFGDCEIRVIRYNSQSYRDTSAGIGFHRIYRTPIIDSITPIGGLPDTVCKIMIYGKWEHHNGSTNTYVKIGPVIRPIRANLWNNNYLQVAMSDSVPWGNQNVSVVYEGKESAPKPILVGLPADSLLAKGGFIDFDYSLNYSTKKADMSTGLTYSVDLNHGSRPFAPIVWNGKNFTMTYGPLYGVTSKVTGTLDQYNGFISSLSISHTYDSSGTVTIALQPGKVIPLTRNYMEDYPLSFFRGDGFPPAVYQIPKDSLSNYLKASGSVYNKMTFETYTMDTLVTSMANQFIFSLKKGPK